MRNDESFRDFIMTVCDDYYEIYSLKKCRIWGDKTRVVTGSNVHLNNAIINTVSGRVEIGDYSFFGHSVSVLTGTHNLNKVNLERQSTVPESGRDVIIGKGVWVSSNATIIGPCTIGDYSVIGVGAVVVGDVKPKSFYAGVPAKCIKQLDIGGA